MATKKFIIEVEEGPTHCDACPLYTEIGSCSGGIYNLDCYKYNLATIKTKELEENNESKS